MNFFKISIKVSGEKQEELIATLSDLEATGFEQLNDYLLVYFSETNFNRNEVEEAIKEHFFETTMVEEENWNAVWESNFQPVIIDAFCAIRADFHEPIKSVQHEIVITPKMSFGTGHHATTYMMIQQMGNTNFNGKTVFDFGTGTGILAILAEKLGAVSITAIDNDEWSIRNSIENSNKNKCARINIYQSAQLPVNQKFDIILANINKNVILENLPALSGMLAKDAVLILSGLLKEDAFGVSSVCKGLSLQLYNKLEKENWISLAYKPI